MNTNGISHRLFVAALAQDGQTTSKRPSPVRVDPGRGGVKMRSIRSSPPFGALASRPVSDWSWSGWQHTMI